MAEMQQGTAGRFGIKKQSALGTRHLDDTVFAYVAFTACDMVPLQGIGSIPPEAGQREALPRATFKTGVHAQGGIDVVPRMESKFGYYLEAAFGDASTSTDQTIPQYIAAAGTTSGCNAHLFGPVSNDAFSLPYLTVHRLLPNNDSTKEVGEIYQDCRIAGFTLNAMSADIVRARFDFVGRVSDSNFMEVDPSWAVPTLDSEDTFAVTACTGSVQMLITDGTPSVMTAFDVTSARLTVVNVLLPPGRSRIIGSPHPKDFPKLSQIISFDTVILLEDYDQYVQMVGGAQGPTVGDSAWNCSIAKGDLDVTLQSPAQIGTTGEYYQMRYRTTQGNVDWSVRPLVVMPNEPVVLALTGTVTTCAPSALPFEFYMQNAHTNYN